MSTSKSKQSHGILYVHIVTISDISTSKFNPQIIRILSVCISIEVLACFSQLIHYSVYAHNGVGAPALRGAGDRTHRPFLLFSSLFIHSFEHGLQRSPHVLVDLDRQGMGYHYLILGPQKHHHCCDGALHSNSPQQSFTHRPALWQLTLRFSSGIEQGRILSLPTTSMTAGQVPYLLTYPTFNNRPPHPRLGYIVLILRFGTFLWFVWCLRTTIRLESLPEKRKFYYIFGGAYALWFNALPIFVLIGATIPVQYVFRTVTGIAVAFEFLSLAALAFLLWPSRASNYFVIKTSPQLISVGDEEAATGGSYGSTAAAAYNDL